MANGLTSKQKLFVEAYLECWNATESARRAGYEGNENTLGSVGWENMQKPAIKQHIKERLQETCMSADEVLMRLAEQARGDFTQLMTVDGTNWKFNLEEVKRYGHLIKKVKQGANGLEIEFHDQQAALQLIGKAHGLFVDKKELTGPDGGPLMVKMYEKVSPEDWDADEQD